MGDAAVRRFRCPGCGADIEVGEAIRRTLLEEGCVVCGGRVSAADFA